LGKLEVCTRAVNSPVAVKQTTRASIVGRTATIAMKYSLRNLMIAGTIAVVISLQYVAHTHREYTPALLRVFGLAVCLSSLAGGITAFRNGKNKSLGILFSVVSALFFGMLILDLFCFPLLPNYQAPSNPLKP
jgi:hypothetical protein